MQQNKFLSTHPTVAAAIANRHPVVALESTIISHGMPFPENVQTALLVEDIIRKEGAIPATIALLDGKLVAGLDEAQITRLGQMGQQVAKVSRRDIPHLLATGQPGATTVAATMYIAAQAGIRIFATGGIGGVHRGAATTMDISADLQELAHTNVGVVCAGAKSILDLPLTLEYLETHGVPVIGFGTDEFPAFYTRKSGLPVDFSTDDTTLVARCLHAKWEAGLSGGVIIANPVPMAYSMDADHIQQIIEQALAAADAKGITGKAITPFLLSHIQELTAGQSLVSNIELVKNNAKLAAQIAVTLAGLDNAINPC
ncbi:MAG: pseudouridine-5'-phosphate glycosidase [Saprospiraceae bacterium]